MSSKSFETVSKPFQKPDFRQFGAVLVLAAFLVSYLGQINYDSWLRYSPSQLSGVSYNVFIEPEPLSGPVARATSFGATEFMADYHWLTLIQYYGGGTPNGQYRKLAELFNLVTDLSPKFEQAYQTGLIILPGEGFSDQAIALGEKGQRNLPNSWEMPYYTGLVYHIYKKDYVNAAKQFQIAADLPGAPPITKLFVGIYYKAANQRQVAEAIFQTVYQTSTDSYVKERAGKYLAHLQLMTFLEDGAQKYRTKFGIFPANLQQLVTGGIITAIPADPLDTGLKIDPQTGVVSETKS